MMGRVELKGRAISQLVFQIIFFMRRIEDYWDIVLKKQLCVRSPLTC